MLSVEKVYDELYGMIEDLKKQIAALSGGDEVTITPALESGTKVADYSIGDTEGSLFAPTPEAYSDDYSTAEQEIGTWTDGSTLYRRTYNGTCATSETGINLESDVQPKAIYGGVYSNAGGQFIPGGTSYSNNSVMILGVDEGVVRVVNAYYATLPNYTFTVLYTKTPPEPEAKKTRKK